MSKDFVFWFYVLPKSNFVFLWDMPKDLVKVVVNQHGIKSDSPMHVNGNDVLDISLSDITEIKTHSSKGGPFWIDIDTNQSKYHGLLTTNPFDPRLLSHRNYDEAASFLGIVKALTANTTPEFDDNPYIRQSKRKDKPDYVNMKLDFPWDKSVTPWKYYFEFVPVSKDKTSLFVAGVWKYIMLSLILWLAFGVLLAIYTQVTHADRVLIEKIFVPTVPVVFGLLVVGLFATIYARIKQ